MSVLPVPRAMIYAMRVRDLECRNVKEQRIDCRHVMTVECLRRRLLASCESPAHMRFQSTGSDPVRAAPACDP
jgi:hypothetical protein